MSAKDVLAGMGQAVRAVREVSDSKGAVPLWAAWRQGLAELGQAAKPFPESIQAPSELGGVGTVTPGEVTKAKEDGPDLSLE